MAMLGGDEVSAIVVDLGSYSCKAGYAGEDIPKAVFPSFVGQTFAGNVTGNAMEIDGDKSRKLHAGVAAINYRRDDCEIVPAMRDGLIEDWDVVEALLDHALKDRLLIDPKDHPHLLAEPTFNTAQKREKYVQLMFEKYEVPAVFLAKNAVLSSFASGRATSLVVDSGAGSTTVAAVQEGYVLQKSIQKSPIAGDLLTKCMSQLIRNRGLQVKPRYSFKRKEINPGEYEVIDLEFPQTADSYREYMQLQVIADIKESLCRTPEVEFHESNYSNIPTTPYELPDGQIIEVGSERFKIPELLFKPSLIRTIAGFEKWETEQGGTPRGLAGTVVESINRCDADIRRELFSSVLVSGGTTSFQQFKERLEKDLVEQAPQLARVKVMASSNPIERKFSVWIGGSILASLGSFQQLWLSKQEFEEHGISYISRKCP